MKEATYIAAIFALAHKAVEIEDASLPNSKCKKISGYAVLGQAVIPYRRRLHGLEKITYWMKIKD